jgi:transcriptional regulator of arginine metabolism
MKNLRQEAILKIIDSKPVFTQEMLVNLLQEQGWNVTQATVSRDIKELRIVKVLDSNGIYRYSTSGKNNANAEEFQYREIFSHSAISIDYAVNNVVIKCHSGMAQGACASLDMMNCDNVLGTLAGDDTILVIVRTEKDAVELTNMLRNLIA